jgi:adenylosuccinate synthase
MDLVALQYACMLNGVTQLVITKADVLDAFEELSICTSYKINGRETSEIPFQMNNCPIEPQYKNFKGWEMETSQLRDEKNLPDAMKSYIDFINKNLTAKVRFISNGPGRDQIIKIQP